MSKSSKSGLTGSRKNAARRSKPAPARERLKSARLDSLDRICRCSETLEMLGGLLAGLGENPKVQVVREAGSLLEDQVKLIRRALADLEAAR
jgi:hypothetical protein